MTTPLDATAQNTAVLRDGERDLVITRVFDAPTDLVYRAWSEPELFRRWWVPASVAGISLVGCDMDVRTAGTYRLEFTTGSAETMAFYGKYIDVVPGERLVWTNDEGEEGGVTTVTFLRSGEKSLLQYRERHRTRDEREEALQGSAAALPEQLDQLQAVLNALQH